jgi:hypothetical protein
VTSTIHLLMFAEVGIALLAGLFLQINARGCIALGPVSSASGSRTRTVTTSHITQ